MSGYVEYSSNNSGGDWWLADQNWKDLESAGWEVEWGGRYFCNTKYDIHRERPVHLVTECAEGTECRGHRRFLSADQMADKDRWLGCLAKAAIRRGLSLRDAVDEWERVTGMNSTDAGCACCGQPHSFTEYSDDGHSVASGPDIEYVARWR